MWLPRRWASVVAAVSWVAAAVVAVIGTWEPTPNDPAAPTPAAAVANHVRFALASTPPTTANHDQDGQNVIYGEATLPFPNPFTGSQHDNVFTGRAPFGTTLLAATRPANPSLGDDVDSILLPRSN